MTIFLYIIFIFEGDSFSVEASAKAGLPRKKLAMRSSTTEFYISRIENNKTDIEMLTFRKINEAVLGEHLRMTIELFRNL